MAFNFRFSPDLGAGADNVEVGDVTEDVMGKASLVVVVVVVGNAFGPVDRPLGRPLKSDKSAKGKSPKMRVSLLGRVMRVGDDNGDGCKFGRLWTGQMLTDYEESCRAITCWG